MNKTGYTKSIFWLIILHGVSSYEYRSCLFHFICSSCQDFSQHCRIQTIRKSYDIQRNLRFPSHRINIAERICRCNLTESIGVIHNWSEEVHGLNQCNILCHFIDCRIIGRLDAYEQIVIMKFW